MIGHLCFQAVEPASHRTWELGFIFNPRHQRHGFATEASRALVQHAFTQIDAHRVVALDGLASKHAGRPVRYFGDCIPARFEETETPVLCRIRPTHVVALDATAGAVAR